MHRMTRLPGHAIEAGDATSVAPFDGRAFSFKQDVARLEVRRGQRVMALHSAERGDHLYRVTRVIGGRYREDFAGIEVAETGGGLTPLIRNDDELVLPVSYLIGRNALRLKGYSVMVGERPGLRAGGIWNRTCIFCHNTVPYIDDLLGTLHGGRAPGYQGEVVDRALPVDRQLAYRITDETALAAALQSEVQFLGAATEVVADARTSTSDAADTTPAQRMLRRAIGETRLRFGARHFVELGIGCESCHGGAKEHAETPNIHPTFEPRAPFLKVSARDREISAAEWQNRACARCHQVLFSRYPYTWEGGKRRDATQAGGSHITSGEARDFLLGGCARAMKCTTCHDPHGRDDPDRLARLATPAGNGVCTGCHAPLATETALRTHAHHDPKGAGASCVGCHMPLKNMGLGYAPTRYHRIGSPTDTHRVEHDRPLECALCHADKTVAGLLEDIGRLWGKRYDAGAMQALYGPSLDGNALVVTIDRGLPHEQAAAIGALGALEKGASASAGATKAPNAKAMSLSLARAAIERQMKENSYPLVRYTAHAVLEKMSGRALPMPDDVSAVAGAHPVRGDHGDDED